MIASLLKVFSGNISDRLRKRKPIAIAGNVRGIGDEKEVDRVDLSQFATEVEATGIYIRTISIEHR